MTLTIQEADAYMDARTGKFEYRRVRYLAALGVLENLGLDDSHTVVDIGAGWTELDYVLRTDGDWRGRYIPIDAGIDSTDLETWKPPRKYDFAVALELLEHLHDPKRLIKRLQRSVTRGIVVSVPNPRTVDVIGIDPTHVTVVTKHMMKSWGFSVTEHMFCGGVFSGGEPDSLLGVWRA